MEKKELSFKVVAVGGSEFYGRAVIGNGIIGNDVLRVCPYNESIYDTVDEENLLGGIKYLMGEPAASSVNMIDGSQIFRVKK